MMTKAIIRASTKKIRDHWNNADNNEEVRIVATRGLAHNHSIDGAVAELAGYAIGGKCQKPLAELIQNPDDRYPASDEDFERGEAAFEAKYGLQGRPKICIEHWKNGKRHRHTIYARCDENGKAAPMPFTRVATMEISAMQYQAMNVPMPKGVQAFMESQNRAERLTKHQSKDISIKTFQTAERQGIDSRDLSAIACKAWQEKNFAATMKKHGYALAVGDRRGYVLVDTDGQVIGLRGLLKPLNLKAKDLTAALGSAPTIEQAQNSFPRPTAKQFNAAANPKTANQEHTANPDVIKLREALTLQKAALDVVKNDQRSVMAEFENMARGALAEHAAHPAKGFSVMSMESAPTATITITPGRPVGPEIRSARNRLLNEQRAARAPMVFTGRAMREGLRRLNLLEHGKRVATWLKAQRSAFEKAMADTWGRPSESERRARLEQEFRDQMAADAAKAAAAEKEAARKAAIPASTLDDHQQQPKSRVYSAEEAQRKQREERLAGRTGRGGGGRSHTPQIKKPSGPSV